MKSRLVVAVAMVLALASVTGAVSRVVSSAPSKPPAAHAALTPRLAAYLGAFEPGAPPDYAPVASFAQAAGQVPNLIGYYSGWAEPFNVTFANTLRSHGVIPYVQIDPTDASVSAIADGTYDEYLRSYADSVRNFKDAVVIGFGHEMNANWYSWGYGHVAPPTFIAAWRHLVTVFRQQGADNVTWLWTVQADGPHTGPVQDWWPGASYVTWVGVDGYYYRPTDTFSTVFGRTIDQVRTVHQGPGTAVGDRGWPRGRPVPEDPGPVPRGDDLQHARAGVVRQEADGRPLPPGLAAGRQRPGRRIVPARCEGRHHAGHPDGITIMSFAVPQVAPPAAGPVPVGGIRRAAGPRWALGVVLLVQAGLSVRLVWTDTAFQDEALYLRAGHLEWAHWLHHAPIPDFPAYFSGAPVAYPLLGALADGAGGLAAARLLSLAFMLGVTALLWATTTRLYGRRAALLACGLFATLAGTQFLGSLATFDAPAVFLLALATWLGVRAATTPANDQAPNPGDPDPGGATGRGRAGAGGGRRDQVRHRAVHPGRDRGGGAGGLAAGWPRWPGPRLAHEFADRAGRVGDPGDRGHRGGPR